MIAEPPPLFPQGIGVPTHRIAVAILFCSEQREGLGELGRSGGKFLPMIRRPHPAIAAQRLSATG